jgi:hypothetical protein
MCRCPQLFHAVFRLRISSACPSDRVSDCSELAAIREFDRLSHLPSASNGWLPAAGQLGFLLPPKSLQKSVRLMSAIG